MNSVDPHDRPTPGPFSPADSRLRRLLLLAGEKSGLVADAPPIPVREVFRRFWPWLKPYRRWIPVALIAIVASTAIATVEIWLFKLIVDQVLLPGDLKPLAWIAAAYLGLLIAGGIASFAEDYVGTWITESFVLDLRCDLLAHAQTLSPSFLDRRHLGDTLARLTGDVRAIESFMVEGVSASLAAALRIIFFFGALFVLEWRLAIVAMLTAPLLWVATRVFLRWIKEASRDQRRHSGSISAIAEGALSNHVLVTASNRQEHEVSRLRREGRGALRAELATSRIGGLLGPLVDVAELAGMMAIVVLGSIAVSDGSLTLGGLLVFVTYLGKLYSPVRDLGALGESMFEAAAGAERVIEILDQQPEVRDAPGARPLRGAIGQVEFDSVSFSYDRDLPAAVSDFSLTVRPGEMVALTGPSGSGKSTLAKLLLRLHDPDSGAVRVDGHDLRDITLASLRTNVSILLQEAPIMRGTVAENIGYARPEAALTEIEEAARAAAADSFVRSLPDGYESDLGERGRSLSGGQRQRIAIARAILADAPVLILDEPSTGLDPASRDALVAPLRRLTEDRTTLLISHDETLIAAADRVIELAPAEAEPILAVSGEPA